MADKKVSELDAITGANTAADDLFLIVDTSGAVTKKITRAELNNAIERDVLSTVNIDGGTIDGTTIGGTTAAAGTFTDLTATGTLTGILGNVSEDTTPQLGGDLDTNGNDINFGDNDKAVFGAGPDLEIYSDGNYARIMETGGLFLVLDTNGSKISLTSDNSNNMGEFVKDGAVQLFHSGSQKFSTTSTGIDVTGTVTADSGTHTFGDGTGSSQFVLLAGTTGTSTLDFGDSDDGNIGRIQYEHTNDALTFRTNNSERVRITSGGNVGIGTTSPSRLLSLNSANASIDFSNGTWTNEIINSAGQMEFRADHTNAAGSSLMKFSVDGSEAMRIGSTGIIYVNGDGTGGRISGDGSGGLVLQDGNGRQSFVIDSPASGSSQAMTLDASGNLGIGTSSPSKTLHVSSNAFTYPARITQTGGTTVGLEFTNTGSGANPPVVGSKSDDIFFETSNTERMRITSGGNVGIGTTTVNAPLVVNKAQGNNNAQLMNSSAGGYGFYSKGGGGSSGYYTARFDNYAGTERVRIDSSGDLLVGTTQTFPAFNNVVGCEVGGFGQISASRDGAEAMQLNRKTSDGDIAQFRRQGTQVGSISVSGSSTAYNTSSDHRLKENVADMTGAITRVKQLAPKRFNFIADTTDTLVDGFLAHEAQTVVPEAITGTHNEVDDDGNAVMQGIDQSKLVPLLTAALKESIAKIETLETQRADLETRLTALEGA